MLPDRCRRHQLRRCSVELAVAAAVGRLAATGLCRPETLAANDPAVGMTGTRSWQPRRDRTSCAVSFRTRRDGCFPPAVATPPLALAGFRFGLAAVFTGPAESCGGESANCCGHRGAPRYNGGVDGGGIVGSIVRRLRSSPPGRRKPRKTAQANV